MGTFSNDIPLLDVIINLFENENLTITMIVYGKLVSFSIKPFDVHRLIALSYKDVEEPINTNVDMLSDKDKIHWKQTMVSRLNV